MNSPRSLSVTRSLVLIHAEYPIAQLAASNFHSTKNRDASDANCDVAGHEDFRTAED